MPKGPFARPIALEFRSSPTDDRGVSPGQTNTKPDKAELEAAIDALLKEIDTTCHRFENPAQAQEDDELAEYTRAAELASKARSAQPPPTDTPGPSDPTPVDVGESAERSIEASAEGMNTLLEEAADRLIESLEQQIAPPPSPEIPATAAAPVPREADASELLESAMDELLGQEAVQQPPEPTDASAVGPMPAAQAAEELPSGETPARTEPVTDVFADLDAAFDELLEGTFETADGQAVDTEGVDTSPDPSLMLDSAATNATAPAAPESIAPKPEARVQPTQAQQAVGAPTAAEPVPAAPAAMPAAKPATVAKPGQGRRLAASLDGIWVLVRRLIGGVLRRGELALRPIGARVLIVLSKPLEGKPPQVRDSIGWVALWTLFLAVCVWAYAVLRPAPVPANDGRASAVVTPDTPRDP
jgi:hypothetical protein